MLKFRNKTCGEVRIWIGNFPDASYEPDEVVEYVIAADPKHHFRTQACVELYRPTGPRIENALLGAVLETFPSNQLILQVGILENGDRHIDSRASSTDEVRVGLPRHFVHEVNKAMAASGPWPGGRLSITHAAHGRAGSSQWAFGYVCQILARLLMAPEVSESNPNVHKIINDVSREQMDSDWTLA